MQSHVGLEIVDVVAVRVVGEEADVGVGDVVAFVNVEIAELVGKDIFGVDVGGGKTLDEVLGQ